MRLFSFGVESIGLRFIFLFLLDFVIILLGAISFSLTGSWTIIPKVILPILGFALMYFVYKDLRNYLKGDDGEVDVRVELNKLPKDYEVVSDVDLNLQKGNIDYVVVSPHGIWTVEVKKTKDTAVIHDKFLEEALAQPQAEALALEDMIKKSLGLTLKITPLFVYANKKIRINFGERPANGVYVVGIKWLNKLILDKENPVSPEDCLKIKEEISKYTSRIN